MPSCADLQPTLHNTDHHFSANMVCCTVALWMIDGLRGSVKTGKVCRPGNVKPKDNVKFNNEQ